MSWEMESLIIAMWVAALIMLAEAVVVVWVKRRDGWREVGVRVALFTVFLTVGILAMWGVFAMAIAGVAFGFIGAVLLALWGASFTVKVEDSKMELYFNDRWGKVADRLKGYGFTALAVGFALELIYLIRIA